MLMEIKLSQQKRRKISDCNIMLGTIGRYINGGWGRGKRVGKGKREWGWKLEKTGKSR